MGAATAGANMGKSAEEGQKLLDNFFAGFPELKKAIEDSKAFLKKNEYVEDFLGRRRRLPEINLPKYTIKLKENKSIDENFNPILGCQDRVFIDPRIQKWQNEIDKSVASYQAYRAKRAQEKNQSFENNGEMGNKKFEELAKLADKDGVILQANTARIAQASRQCFNARIQGSAASLTKLAMIDIFKDKELNDLCAKLIIPVHDELLVECPALYADRVEDRLAQVMIDAAKRGGDDVPQSCDPYNVSRWASDVYAAFILAEYKKLLLGDEDKGIAPLSEEAAFIQVCNNHEEIPQEAIEKVLNGEADELLFE